MAKIYAIRNKISGKQYIGSTRQHGNNRWKCHYKNLVKNTHHSGHLQRAWNKYGEENFEYIIIEDNVDNDIQFEREQYWMDYYKSYIDGYNIAKHANRIEFSDEARQHLSDVLKGRKLTPEHIKAFSEAKRGEKRTDETKEKMRQAALGRKHDEETKNKIGESCKGRKFSEETKKRMSEAAKLRHEKKRLEKQIE